jgi:cytochrome c
MSRFPEARIVALLSAAALAAGLMATGAVYAQQRPQQATARTAPAPAPARTGLGREARPDEVAAWDIDIRPDGQGLPPGRGSVKQGEEIYLQQCATCHGEFGEGAGRWPVLAGGRGSLRAENPEKTVGSFWPYLSTTFDYVRRTMPYGNARSLADDEVYALTAYLLFMNDVVPESFELTRENFTSVQMPNVGGFYDDDRETTERRFWNRNPCMSNCNPAPATVTNRARIDVTPDSRTGPRVE